MLKSKMPFILLVLVILVALLIAPYVNSAPKDGPTVTLNVAQNEFNSAQDVLISVNISNPTKHTIRVLKWYTPIDGVEDPLFFVLRDGKAVEYIGAIYKRPPITGNDYISLKSGESIERVVNLGDYYDLSVTGKYEVSYAAQSYNLFDEKGNDFKYKSVLTSEKISFRADGRQAKGKPAPPPPPPPGGNTFNACTTDQQTQLISARSQAKSYASDSESYMFGNRQGSRYTTWFGILSDTRYNTVKDNFAVISNAMDNAGINFDCKCKQNYYAYVYPNQPYNIYLCKVFWQASLSGTDSKAGTLIHEMSHFNVTAHTDDLVYGKTNAINLAISNPDEAIRNADNHEYFSENTPPLQ